MCGLAVIARSLPGAWTPADEARLQRATQRLSRRGPDGSGLLRTPDRRITLAHTRLAIQDLSVNAAQPMTSPDGRASLVYNGEIYNVAPLRDELSRLGVEFRTRSDTEVLLHGLLRWGVEHCLDRLRGMFAFAFVRTDQHGALHLHAAVDHCGMKPLFWSFDSCTPHGPTLSIASDGDALVALRPGASTLNMEHVARMLSIGFSPAPGTIWSGVRKLAPGRLLSWRLGDERAPELRPWWAPLRETGDITPADPAQHFREVFPRIAAEHTIGDVPAALFLSAGLDSTAVALAIAHSGRAESTQALTLATGTHDDESPDAADTARSLGFNHQALRIDRAELSTLVDAAAEAFDEPQGFSALLTAAHIACAARQQACVKVVLSGDGGDEAFAGYSWHSQDTSHPLSLTAWTPADARPTEHARLADLVAEPDCDAPTRASAKLALGGLSYTHRYLRRIFPGFHPAESRALLGLSRQNDSADGLTEWLSPEDAPQLPHPRRAQRLDVLGFCAQSILPKVDRACMSVGLELRSPFLDRRVLDWALALPAPSDPRAHSPSKQVVRQFLGAPTSRHALRVPARVLSRPKQGFSLRLATPECPRPMESLLPRVDRSEMVRDGALRRDYGAFLAADAETREVQCFTLAMLCAWYDRRRAFFAR